MKNLSALLSQGNLTPRERMLLRVADQVSEERDGKKILSEAEKHALVEGWHASDSSEIREYNRYNDGWNKTMYANLDAQTYYLNAEFDLQRVSRIVDRAMYIDERYLERCAKVFEGFDVDEDAALELILNNSGLALEDVEYRLTFQMLSEETREDILALCPDAEMDPQYLDHEEAISELFNGKGVLLQEKHEALADRIVASLFNPYAAFVRSKGLLCEDWWFDRYYADLPGLEIVKKWAEYNGIDYEAGDEESETEELTQKIKEYAEKHTSDIRALLKQTILKWLNNGLMLDYAPLCVSEEKATCNDKDTKLAHKEVFKEWMKAKDKAKARLRKLIDEGIIKTEERSNKFLGVDEPLTLITGKSLYECASDHAFVNDFKKQADEMKLFGCLILFVRERDFLKDGATLLRFQEMFKRVSKVYEIDAGYKIDRLVNNLERSVDQLNTELEYIADKFEGAIHQKHDIAFALQLLTNDVLIKIEEEGEDETTTHYLNAFKEALGGEF